MIQERGGHIKTGTRKAAILLVAMGAEAAAEVMRHLREDEILALMPALASAGRVPAAEAVDVMEEAVHTAAARDYVCEGGVRYAEALLEATVGPEKASAILGRVAATLHAVPFSSLRNVDPLLLASALVHELPQTAALVLAHLPPEKAAAVLSALPPDLQAEVAARIATAEPTAPQTAASVEQALTRNLSPGTQQRWMHPGGIDALARIVAAAPRDTEQLILRGIEERAPELSAELRRRLFTFEDVAGLDDRSIQTLLRAVDPKDLALALKGAPEEIRRRFLSNMSRRASEMLLEDMQYLGPVRKQAVEEARQRIAQIARRLEESGEIVGRARGEDYL